MSSIERLRIMIDDMRKSIEEIKVEFAEDRGEMETLEKLFPNDGQVQVLARLTKGMANGFQARIEDDLTLMTTLYKLS